MRECRVQIRHAVHACWVRRVDQQRGVSMQKATVAIELLVEVVREVISLTQAYIVAAGAELYSW